VQARSPLVSADWLLEHISDEDLRVLDATWVPPFLKDRASGRDMYEAGHIPGAPYFDIDEIAAPETGLSHMLPGPDLFATKIAALGISNETSIVVYDQNSFFASARAWWMFRAMGHEKTYVLDGGMQAWKAAGGIVTTDAALTEPREFTATPVPVLIRNMITMRGHVDAQDAAILDARDHGRFNGTSPEPRAGLPSGHMPGSFCVPASSLIADNATLKTSERLAPLLNDYLDRPIITSCGSGVSAAVISLALAQLGKWDAALYDGSWSEWASDPQNPIERAS
jgi:thiosulfate/3-mercaptopyruvate sulfurtransferase